RLLDCACVPDIAQGVPEENLEPSVSVLGRRPLHGCAVREATACDAHVQSTIRDSAEGRIGIEWHHCPRLPQYCHLDNTQCPAPPPHPFPFDVPSPFPFPSPFLSLFPFPFLFPSPSPSPVPLPVPVRVRVHAPSEPVSTA